MGEEREEEKKKFSYEDLKNIYQNKQWNYNAQYDPDFFWHQLGEHYCETFEDNIENPDTKNPFTLNLAALGSRISNLKPKTILEVGCGFGRVLAALEVNKSLFDYDKLIGIEFSDTMIEQSKKYYNLVKELKTFPQIIKANARSLPFEDKSFDMVYTHVCLTHIPPEHILDVYRELNRVAGKWIMLIERFNFRYEHSAPHRWSHEHAPYFMKRGWKIKDYAEIHKDHHTKLLLLEREDA